MHQDSIFNATPKLTHEEKYEDTRREEENVGA